MASAIWHMARHLARLASRPAARVTAAAGLMLSLNACAIPPVISVAKLAADGVLFASTGKTSTDHGLSMATGKDCETLRVLASEDVCQEQVVAQVEPVPAEIVRDRAAVDALAMTAPADTATRKAMADQALALAFRPHAAAASSASGAAPSAAEPQLAALPKPADGSVHVARAKTSATVRVASAEPAIQVPSRPGRIKISAAPRPRMVIKAAVRDAVPALPAIELDAAPEAPPPAGERAGAMERLSVILKKAFRIARGQE